MTADNISFINRMLQNIRVDFKDAGDKICDESWACGESWFPYDSIGFIKRGKIFLSVNGRGGEVEEGGLYYIPAMSNYAHHVVGKTADVYWTHFGFGEGALMAEFPISVLSPCPNETIRIYERLFKAMESRKLGAPLEISGLMHELAAHYFGMCAEFCRPLGDDKAEKMRGVAGYVADNLDKNLSVEYLAGQAGLNPNYFIKVFHHYFHETPIQFVLSRREEAARNMLENSKMSVKQIGLSLGFSNQNYFSEFFKKRSGYSPSAYRALKNRE